MFEQVLASPLVPEVAKLIQSRLGRPLEPFDIWYDGFRPRGAYTEAQLDAIVAKKYPTAEAYQKDIPICWSSWASLPKKPRFWRTTSSWTQRAVRATPWARKCEVKKHTCARA